MRDPTVIGGDSGRSLSSLSHPHKEAAARTADQLDKAGQSILTSAPQSGWRC